MQLKGSKREKRSRQAKWKEEIQQGNERREGETSGHVRRDGNETDEKKKERYKKMETWEEDKTENERNEEEKQNKKKKEKGIIRRTGEDKWGRRNKKLNDKKMEDKN